MNFQTSDKTDCDTFCNFFIAFGGAFFLKSLPYHFTDIDSLTFNILVCLPLAKSKPSKASCKGNLDKQSLGIRWPESRTWHHWQKMEWSRGEW